MIRRATLRDMSGIFGVHTCAVRSITGHYSPRDIDVWSGRKSSDAFARTVASKVVLVDEEEREIRAFAQLDLGTSMVEAVYVAPEHWRKGIGSRLLTELESVARAAEKTELTLDASLNSVEFYESAGYTGAATALHELCPGTNIACIVMHKHL